MLHVGGRSFEGQKSHLSPRNTALLEERHDRGVAQPISIEEAMRRYKSGVFENAAITEYAGETVNGKSRLRLAMCD